YLLVDGVRGVVGHLLVLRHLAAQEYFAALFRVRERAQLVRQAPLRDHVAGELRGALDVVGSAGGHGFGSEDDLFGDAAAEQRGDRAFDAALGERITILLRQELRDAQRAAARNDRDLVDRIVLGHGVADD